MGKEELECIHGMNPQWCANCKGLLTPEEEENKVDESINIMIERWGRL